MEDILSSLATYGYLILFVYSLGGGFVALLAAGMLSAVGKMDFVTTVTVAFAANFLGDMLLFYMARYNKKEVMRHLRPQRRKLALAHLLMRRYGSRIIFFQKFIYGVKTLIPLAIGLTRYEAKRFSLYNLGSALVWAIVVGFAGYAAGEAVARLLEEGSHYSFLMPVFLLALLGGI